MTSSVSSAVVAVDDALRRAVKLAELGPAGGVNPRVGCVVLDAAGAVVGQGWHEGAGTAHAEVAALAQAGAGARGGTAVVTLEPCSHTGRTGPCTEALLAAGVAKVVYGRADRDPVAAGGAERLRAAGATAELVGAAELRTACERLVERWQQARDLGRPVVTWKVAATLDGRTAATDGTSRWITGQRARRDVHRLRALCDVVLVGTGTAWADDPLLTVRDDADQPTARQPLRAVLGLRGLPEGGRLAQAAGRGEQVLTIRSRDPRAALEQLWDLDHRQVWLEGGATIAAALWRAGLVDHVVAYVAPALLGAGAPLVGDLGIGTITQTARLRLREVTRLGDDVRLDLDVTADAPSRTSTEGAP